MLTSRKVLLFEVDIRMGVNRAGSAESVPHLTSLAGASVHPALDSRAWALRVPDVRSAFRFSLVSKQRRRVTSPEWAPKIAAEEALASSGTDVSPS